MEFWISEGRELEYFSLSMLHIQTNYFLEERKERKKLFWERPGPFETETGF